VSRPEPRWLGRLVVDEAHFRQIRAHGGIYGLRDENALESALARPKQRWNYDEAARLPDLAAAYAYGLATNHPNLDGNKRVALVAMVAFLDRNGVELTATNAEALSRILALAAGQVTETELATWIEERSKRAA
jgi:death on curing protein